MELAALWVVLIALGAFLLGLVGGWFGGRRRATTSATSMSAPAGPEEAADAAGARTGALVADAAITSAEAGAAPTPELPGPEPSTPARLGRDERARYAEIIGMETENASLRAVAARVPALERRIRKLEAAAEARPGSVTESVIDLTGPEPLLGSGNADATSR